MQNEDEFTTYYMQNEDEFTTYHQDDLHFRFSMQLNATRRQSSGNSQLNWNSYWYV